jgi:2-polyprenyl-6-methoxyphenol hydroxylase-like FAD-dependent oxidoreductase
MMATGLERIAVVGAGPMGTYLALDWARAGHPVTIYDTDHERARTLPERAREIGLQLLHGGVTNRTSLDEAVARLVPHARWRMTPVAEGGARGVSDSQGDPIWEGAIC